MEHYLEAIRQQARIERAHEALLKLPLPVVLALVWLAGTMLMCDGDLLVLVAFASRNVISDNRVQGTPLTYVRP